MQLVDAVQRTRQQGRVATRRVTEGVAKPPFANKCDSHSMHIVLALRIGSSLEFEGHFPWAASVHGRCEDMHASSICCYRLRILAQKGTLIQDAFLPVSGTAHAFANTMALAATAAQI